MKGLGVLCVVLGIAIFVLPLLGVHLSIIYQMGNFRAFASIILILIGIGMFMFSSHE